MEKRTILTIEEVFQYPHQKEWCVSIIYSLEGTTPHGKGIIRFDTEEQARNIRVGDIWNHHK